MSHESLKNPFTSTALSTGTEAKINPNLSALAKQGFLDESDIAKLEKLEEQKDRSSKFEDRSSMEGLSFDEGMSANERLAKHENSPEGRRELIIDWAEKWNLGDEDWVDEAFEFLGDGTAICKGDLELKEMTEPDFPINIKIVKRDLYLRNLTSAEHLNLPTTIGGSLDLRSLTSAKDLNLPETVGGIVVLMGLPAKEKEELHKKYPNLTII